MCNLPLTALLYYGVGPLDTGPGEGIALDTEVRRRKQQELLAELLEQKIRRHARKLYEKRGKVDGLALEDWVKAESEVLATSNMAAAYRKFRAQPDSTTDAEAAELSITR